MSCSRCCVTAAADHEGDEVKNVGDGLMFVFPSASDLVEGAVAVQQRLDARNRNATEPLAVRIGLATGDADAADDDYFGEAVVEAARLCAAADGGQILATETVQLLSRQRTDHEFVPLGARTYKGFDRPIPVCEVQWEPLGGRGLRSPAAGASAASAGRAVRRPCRRASRVDGRAEGGQWFGRAARAGERRSGDRQDDAADRLRRAQRTTAARSWCTGGVTRTCRFRTDRGARSSLISTSISLPPWMSIETSSRSCSAGAESQSSGMDADAARYILYNAVVETLARAASSAPVVVVLEDLHWADAPTVALARHVAQSTDEHGMLVATFREAELDTDHPLTAALAALHREQSVERLPLRGLDDLEVLDSTGNAGRPRDGSGRARVPRCPESRDRRESVLHHRDSSTPRRDGRHHATR